MTRHGKGLPPEGRLFSVFLEDGCLYRDEDGRSEFLEHEARSIAPAAGGVVQRASGAAAQVQAMLDLHGHVCAAPEEAGGQFASFRGDSPADAGDCMPDGTLILSKCCQYERFGGDMPGGRIRYLRTGEGPPSALFIGAGGKVTEGWLEDKAAAALVRQPVRYLFVEAIAEDLSVPGKIVQPDTVMKWTRRYEACPQAAAELGVGLRFPAGAPKLAWLDDPAGAAVKGFRVMLDGRRGQGAPGVAKPGSGNHRGGPRVHPVPVSPAALARAYPLRAAVTGDSLDARSKSGAELRDKVGAAGAVLTEGGAPGEMWVWVTRGAKGKVEGLLPGVTFGSSRDG